MMEYLAIAALALSALVCFMVGLGLVVLVGALLGRIMDVLAPPSLSSISNLENDRDAG